MAVGQSQSLDSIYVVESNTASTSILYNVDTCVIEWLSTGDRRTPLNTAAITALSPPLTAAHCKMFICNSDQHCSYSAVHLSDALTL